MPALATALTQFNDEQDKRTWTVPGHSVASPFLVIQKRKTGVLNGAVAQDNVQIVRGTTDGAGAVLAQRVVLEANVRRPVDADADDIAATLALFREVVASDEFAAMVTTQNYVK